MSTLSHKILFTITVCLLLAACEPGSQRRLDRETLEREMRRREPRRIKEAEIMNAALTQGREIAQIIEQSLATAGEAAGNCCPALPPAVLDSLTQHYKAAAKCYPLRGAAHQAGPLEQQLLEAYRYSLEENLPLKDNIQANGNDKILYTTPIPALGSNSESACSIWLIDLSRKQVVLSIE